VTFGLLPAVDVANGQAVRPVQGVVDNDSIFGELGEVALGWQTVGAELIHMVDLDAAFGRGSNAALLATAIVELNVRWSCRAASTTTRRWSGPSLPGGERPIVGSNALKDPSWCAHDIADHGERIAIGSRCIFSKVRTVQYNTVSQPRSDPRWGRPVGNAWVVGQRWLRPLRRNRREQRWRATWTTPISIKRLRGRPPHR
jgi:phosphoribosylformimino-5-aminoimidazole carboxamide ribonucleotide (ProFAR) isomerase